jgi:NhaP-type Na+/H+ or K+/H+ antiporter
VNPPPIAKPKKIPPRWTIFTTLAGALCAFAAAACAFMHNGPLALVFAGITLAFYIISAIGFAFAKPAPPKASEPA